MNNYNDHKVWKEVELYEHSMYLSEYHKYQPEDILEVASRLLTKGKEEGLQGCYLKFISTMEPYEDYLGPVQVTVCGYRKLNAKERAEEERQDRIYKLAEEKGITFHEASTLLSLQERGKL